MAKNIFYGTGFSKSLDSFKAAKEAASGALNNLNSQVKKKPTISFIFFAGDYDIKDLARGLESVLGGTEYIGGSADAVFYKEKVNLKGIVVLSIQSNYLNVGVASSDDVSSNPYQVSKKTIEEALKKIAIDKYVDPYLLFTRMRKTDIKWMLKIPSFFVMVYSRGMKLPRMGDETQIIKGVADVVGVHVPVWGGSFGTSLEKLFGGKPYDIYAIHNGKIMKDGLIIVVNSCSLLYGNSLSHGSVRTDNLGFISKVSGNGYVVEEISGENAVDWYCKKLKMKKEEFLKNTATVTQLYPLGIPDSYGNFFIRGGGVHSNGKLAYVAPFVEGWPVYVMNAKPKNLLKTAKEVTSDIKEYTSEKKPAIVIAGLCASRRATLGKDLEKELKDLKINFGGADIIGYSCFGEIGSKPGLPPNFGHLTANIFAFYDEMLHNVNKKG